MIITARSSGDKCKAMAPNILNLMQNGKGVDGTQTMVTAPGTRPWLRKPGTPFHSRH